MTDLEDETEKSSSDVDLTNGDDTDLLPEDDILNVVGSKQDDYKKKYFLRGPGGCIPGLRNASGLDVHFFVRQCAGCPLGVVSRAEVRPETQDPVVLYRTVAPTATVADTKSKQTKRGCRLGLRVVLR